MTQSSCFAAAKERAGWRRHPVFGVCDLPQGPFLPTALRREYTLLRHALLPPRSQSRRTLIHHLPHASAHASFSVGGTGTPACASRTQPGVAVSPAGLDRMSSISEEKGRQVPFRTASRHERKGYLTPFLPRRDGTWCAVCGRTNGQSLRL